MQFVRFPDEIRHIEKGIFSSVMGRKYDHKWRRGIVGLDAARQQGDIEREVPRRLLVSRNLIDRLGLEKELHGHTGCVNCLEWNEDGSVLASASDDLHVILWDPFRHKQLHQISTGHTGNIFSVKFIGASSVATAAADSTVRVREVVGGDAPMLVCSCHSGRVKRLATQPGNPFLMWSAAEDGLVIQHDLRTPHRCNTENYNVLVNLVNHLGRYAEAKCVAVNPRRPEQVAVGANDFYVRLYDIRMIKMSKHRAEEASSVIGRRSWEANARRCSRAGQGDLDNNIPRHAVTYFAPGSLSLEHFDNSFPKKATTYVSFNSDGNELLVNIGSDQVYLFNINSARRPVFLESFIIEYNHGYRGYEPTNAAPQNYALPNDVRDIKLMANQLMNNSKYSSAVELYNAAIGRCPDCAVLYSNRAAAFVRRSWTGDNYGAIRDCYTAIRLDPHHVKAHFRLAKALLDLNKYREAQECITYFKRKFPKQANSHAVFLLENDLHKCLETLDRQSDAFPGESDENYASSSLERQWRAGSLDYSQRLVGHCNTTTDIKEANFLGDDARYVAAGSDDGCLFIWCRESGNVIKCLKADESIVNCVQMNPRACLIATSGIESVVRLWSPQPEDGSIDPRIVGDSHAAVVANQQRMSSDPFEAMLLNISFASDDSAREPHSPGCRPS